MAARASRWGRCLPRPLAWLVILYLGSLAVLLIASFWSVDALSGELIKGFTFDNFKELWNTDVYTDGGLPDDRRRLGRDRDRRAARFPDRLLHGQDRLARGPRAS